MGLPANWGSCSRTVSFTSTLYSHACWEDLIAAGLRSGEITILNVTTGVSTSVLSGHTDYVRDLAFTSDGTLLISGSDDKTVKLWDLQTGGIVRSFYGHTDHIFSVSLSPDHAMIASGSVDKTIRLWDTWTGECHCVMDGHDLVETVSFSPTNPQLLMSASRDYTIRQWNVNGSQVGPTYEGNYVAFSQDGTYFVSGGDSVDTIRSADSGAVVAELQVSGGRSYHCCFSPDNKFVAISTWKTIYIWDITRSDPCLIETFSGHTNFITSLTFSSSLISSSHDGSIKFWQIASLMNPVATESGSLPSTPAPVTFVTIQENNGMVISTDSAGVVKVQNILTGHCKASFYASNLSPEVMDARLVNGRMILISYEYEVIRKLGVHILDTKEGESLRIVTALPNRTDLKISGNGSEILFLWEGSIQAQSILTGEVVGEVEWSAAKPYDSLIVDGSRVGVLFGDSQIKWWYFGVPGSTPISLPITSMGRYHLDFVQGSRARAVMPAGVYDTVTGKQVFWLPGRYADPPKAKWNGQFLVVGYGSGELLILNFKHLLP